MGSAHRDLKALPAPVQDDIGYALWLAQIGRKYYQAKRLKGFQGVVEIVNDYQTDTFRAIYTVNLGDRIYVLHVFQKKSKRGISIPKRDLDLIRIRLQEARRLAKERES